MSRCPVAEVLAAGAVALGESALARAADRLDAPVRAAPPLGTAEVRYRRVRSELALLTAEASDRLAAFLAGDAVVLARMASAAAVVREAGLAARALPAADTGVDQLRTAIAWRRYADGPVSELHRHCAADLSRGALRRWSAGGRPVAGRAELRRTQLELVGRARAMCAALRADLHAGVGAVSPRRSGLFQDDVRRRSALLVDDLDRLLAVRLAGHNHPGEAVGGYPPIFPAVRPADLENRLTVLLGGGFGVGSAVTLDRLLAGMGTTSAAIVSLAAGLGLGAWVVHTRRVLSVRSALERWVDEVSGALRAALEQRVAARVLAAEIAGLNSCHSVARLIGDTPINHGVQTRVNLRATNLGGRYR